MTRTYRIVAIVVIAVFASAGVSGAASQGATAKTLAGAGTATVACGALAGVTVSYLTTNGIVTQVRVGGLPAACNGALISVTLTDAAGTDLGSGGPVVVSGGTASVGSLSANPAPGAVANVQLVAIGP